MDTVAVSGKGGSVAGNGAYGATEIKDWRCTLVVDILDATSMASSGWRESITGLRGGSGTFTCIGVPPTAMADNAAAALTLTKSTGGGTIAGSAHLGGYEVTSPVDGVVSYSVPFTFTGEITVTN